MTSTTDVLIVGASFAGLAAATALRRSLRTVVVVDGGPPRNAPSRGAHNVLTRDGTPPTELVRLAREEAHGYGAQLLAGEAVRATGDADGVSVVLADGTELSARRLLLASGVRDLLPEIPGLAERWGRDVLHCPYCHGFEVRGQRIGVLASAFSAHQAQLFRQLSERTSILLDGTPEPTGDEATGLAARGIRLVAGEIDEVVVEDDRLIGVLIAGRLHPLDAMVVGPRVEGRLPEGLGLELVEHPSGVARHLAVDSRGRTASARVFAAGSLVEPMSQVMAAAADGLRVAAALNGDLIEEDIAAAIAAG
ncbi:MULTISPECIES: NAD(P)/FAD-dependent oxidoreductase [unclassified Rathayibacter]|uniref:NAD(P)/FAD-dependent oxidoreductase n=1 Tax=unclassified Rathayibacter TaxID=2609250 RepID=UPI00188D00FF|nr:MULTISPECIES: NAD(P)/FAD-dependent oxidoreductase [unclassified Rathayibacter]MBF4461459.1 NAD(P)/FAD-dependent oxidoreductase [Rathayibacter sp. VKM Ac-2879]MBF4502870.1 NAD(P)/FAD-dependent oxidoreductase [Rathayibacter sp. VKM Ac-2878]